MIGLAVDLFAWAFDAFAERASELGHMDRWS